MNFTYTRGVILRIMPYCQRVPGVYANIHFYGFYNRSGVYAGIDFHCRYHAVFCFNITAAPYPTTDE